MGNTISEYSIDWVCNSPADENCIQRMRSHLSDPHLYIHRLHNKHFLVTFCLSLPGMTHSRLKLSGSAGPWGITAGRCWPKTPLFDHWPSAMSVCVLRWSSTYLILSSLLLTQNLFSVFLHLVCRSSCWRSVWWSNIPQNHLWFC